MMLQRYVAIAIILCFAIVGLPAPGYANTRGNLGNDVLYYITVDRFFDGDSANNIPNYAFTVGKTGDRSQQFYGAANQTIAEASFDPTRRYINQRWGGDLAGIIRHLDYLRDLGVTALVLSPIQDSVNGLMYSPFGGGVLHQTANPDDETFDRFYAGSAVGFQGTWLKDWFEIDEHFRSPSDEVIAGSDRLETFRHLLDAAGDRGIKIILSLPLNGTSPYQDSAEFPEYDPDRFQRWFVDRGGVYRHGQRVATYWDAETLDPQDWFHPPTPIDFKRPTPFALENAAIGGIPDLDQDNPKVLAYLLDAAQFWLTLNPNGHQVSGFYLTQIPNINVRFWQAFEDRIAAIAPESVLIGEYPDGGYRNQGSMTWFDRTEHYSLLDYDLSVAARRFFSRNRSWDGRTDYIRKTVLGKDGMQPFFQRLIHRVLNPSNVLEIPTQSLDLASAADVRGWVNFIENHDLPRLQTAAPQVSEVAYASLLAFVFACPGVPMLMYGTETNLAIPYHIDHAGLMGIGNDPYNQPMMIWPGDPGWNAELFDLTRQLTILRRDYPALRYGTARFLFPKGSRRDADIVMVRELPGDRDPAILYAYSTFGGEFDLSELAPQFATLRAMGAAESESLAEFPLHLEPETANVYVLEPNGMAR